MRSLTRCCGHCTVHGRAAFYWSNATQPLVYRWVVGTLGDLVYNVHVSNAQGLLGEGMPYEVGDYDLDTAVRSLVGTARWMVTETLEPDPCNALLMRDAQSHLRSCLGTGPNSASPTRSEER